MLEEWRILAVNKDFSWIIGIWSLNINSLMFVQVFIKNIPLLTKTNFKINDLNKTLLIFMNNKILHDRI